jgi:hypothetical protein
VALNLDHRPNRIGIFGASGSGKTTLAAKYAANARVRVRAFYDPELEWCRRFNVRPAATPETVAAGLAAGVLCFDPDRMFPDAETGLAYFCETVFEAALQIRGPILVGVDELQDYVKPGWLPAELKQLLQRGRRRECDLLLIGQTPAELGPKVRTQLESVFCFQFSEKNALEWFAGFGFDPDSIQALGPHRWLWRDRWGAQSQG